MDTLELPEPAWSRKEGSIFLVGLSEKILDKIGAVIELHFPEPGVELLPGEPLVKISGTNDDYVLPSPVHGYFIEKNDDALENFHFDGENWLLKFEQK
jgi:glycine cleavage system H lipoate-binding protein